MSKNMQLPDLPEGTITFLFTDIEGSTQLLSQLRDQYATLLSDQRGILREAFAHWHGQEVDTQGDAFFVAFPRATQAVYAAVDIQRSLTTHTWPQDVEVRVRMGIHTGEPLKAEEGYVGMDVHRAARIAHVGHGGQVLLSETTAALVRDELPQGVSLLDLGRHRLKDMHCPEHIRQLQIPGLPSEFPHLKSLAVLPPEISLDVGAIKLPAFLEEGACETPVPLFVGREREIAQLNHTLDQALDGKRGMFFITGGPGEGKTALMDVFVRRGLEAHPDLIVASGKCNAYTGVGDPYLPFRELLRDLSGDIETKWATGGISLELARRLWALCPLTAQSLAEAGPQLVEAFVSGEELVARVATALPEQRGLLQRLRAMVDHQREAPSDLGQKALFEQYTQVLCQIAERHPLLLLLDDLQWADAASINLLFHLGRCLGGNRILVLGAYRPEEVALGREGGKHPLESLFNEFKRLFGDIWLDLSHTPARESRLFVDAILDNEANLLSEGFHEALYRHTEGHPLFTIELLRDLQERGDLFIDEAGRWVAGSQLDWSVLPARVEGVIEARIGRLADELRELLAVASVEGEDFTAQVVARVKQADERGLVRQLSGELDKVHRLVGERGALQIGDQRLYLYRFQHHLFQKYLYNGLGDNERELLHGEVGAVLEELYSANTQAISLLLAHHYSHANDGRKAVPYLIQAGDQARNLYAHQEAISFYQRALVFQEGLGDFGSAARTQMKLGQTYHSAFDYHRANESYKEGFSLWRQASEKRSVTPLALSSQTFRFILRWGPYSLDPGLFVDIDSGIVIGHLFSGLLELTPQMDVVPDIAYRWEILEGGRKYIFHLREDARWSDRMPVTAHDFVYAWRRLLNPATRSESANLFYDIKGAKAFHQGEMPDSERLGVRASAPYTLEVELEAPAGYFLQLLAHPAASPVPQHTIERWGEAWTELGKQVVNGPYRIKGWQPGKLIALERNPEYYGRCSGNLQMVEITFMQPSRWPDEVSMFDADKLDVLQIAYFPTAEINRLRRQRSAEYISAPLQDVFFFVINTSRAPFDNPDVRRAFMLALDNEAVTQTSGRGAVIPALGGLIPPGIPGHSPEIGLPFDPGGAQELMAQAGYPGGRGFPVIEVLLWPGAEVYLENIMNQWQKVLGVKHIWDFAPIIEVPEKAIEKPSHLVLQGWAADYPDPDNFLRIGFRKELSRWQGEVFDELVKRARHAQDQCERIRLYMQADKILIDEAVVLPVAYLIGHYLVQPWVKNFPLSPMGTWFLKDVLIEPH